VRIANFGAGAGVDYDQRHGFPGGWDSGTRRGIDFVAVIPDCRGQCCGCRYENGNARIGGAFSAQLVPNVGATPAITYYTVVFQLDDGTVRHEYWVVPTTSPTTIAAIRTTPGTGIANGLVSKQYVDAAVANRAVDTSVVHLAGPK